MYQARSYGIWQLKQMEQSTDDEKIVENRLCMLVNGSRLGADILPK